MKNTMPLEQMKEQIAELREKRLARERQYEEIEIQTKRWIPTKKLRRIAERKTKVKTVCFGTISEVHPTSFIR